MKVAGADGERIASAIEAMGYVCVPKVPTAEMVHSAWASEMAENAAGVWESMVGFSEGTISIDGSPALSTEAHRVIETQGIGS